MALYPSLRPVRLFDPNQSLEDNAFELYSQVWLGTLSDWPPRMMSSSKGQMVLMSRMMISVGANLMRTAVPSPRNSPFMSMYQTGCLHSLRMSCSSWISPKKSTMIYAWLCIHPPPDRQHTTKSTGVATCGS